jgi:hypothetical protein
VWKAGGAGSPVITSFINDVILEALNKFNGKVFFSGDARSASRLLWGLD